MSYGSDQRNLALAHPPPEKGAARSWARDFVLRGLYQFLLSGCGVSLIAAEHQEQYQFKKADPAFYHELLSGSIVQKAMSQEKLQVFLDRPWEQVGYVEQAILLLATYELMHSLAVPYKVVLHESMELANRYASQESFSFINAVLDPLAAQVRSIEYAKVADQGVDQAT